MHPKQDKYANPKLSAFGQKKIERLLEKDGFKVVMPKKVLSSIQIFNSCFINDIKNLCTDKADKKSCLFVHAYND